jgi:hypothetical protein
MISRGLVPHGRDLHALRGICEPGVDSVERGFDLFAREPEFADCELHAF